MTNIEDRNDMGVQKDVNFSFFNFPILLIYFYAYIFFL